MDRLLAILVSLLLCSCGSSYTEPHLVYAAVFDSERMGGFDDIEESIRRAASRRAMIVEEVPLPFSGDENFTLALFPNETAVREHHVVLWASGYSNKHVRLSFYGRGDMRLSELDEFADDVKGKLEREFGLDFCRYDIELGFCSDEYARREAVRKTTIVPEAVRGFVRRDPCLQFRARYDPTMRETAGMALYALARRRGLDFFEDNLPSEDAEQKVARTRIHLVPRRKRQSSRGAIFELSNEVVPTSLELTVYDDGSRSPEHVGGLADEAKTVLRERLGLQFCRVNPTTLLCDERYAAIEADRVASARVCGSLPDANSVTS